MRKLVFTTLLFSIFWMSSNCQEIKKQELIGQWKVVHVISKLADLIPEEYKSKSDSFATALLKAEFVIEADENFSFTIGAENAELKEMEIRKAHWKFDVPTNSIIVQEWKDKNKVMSKLMEMEVVKEGGKMIFTMIDMFIELTVQKVN